MSGQGVRFAMRRICPCEPVSNAGQRYGDKFVRVTLLVFLGFEVFQGPARYYLSKVGGVLIAYLPKALMLIVFGGLIARALWAARIDRLVVAAAAAFVAFVLVGIHFTKGIAQPLLGVFSLMPLLFGIVAEPAVSRLGERLLPYALGLWLCVAAGVAINNFHSMPWTGFTYQLGDAEVEVSREWSYFGVARIAGFARASFEAATQLLFLGLICAVLLRRRIVAAAVWIATGVLIAVTTTKTTLGLYFFLTFLFVLVVPRYAQRGSQRALGRTLPFMLTLVGVLLPVSTLLTKMGSSLAGQGSGNLLSSFAIRLSQMWPDTFAMIFSHGSALLGRGLGGIGAAQKVLEPELYSPGDNVYLYLYATFGIFALVIIWTITRAISQLQFSGNRMVTVIWLLGTSILIEGWTVSCIEGGTMAVIAGLTFAFSVRSARKVSVRRVGHGELPQVTAYEVLQS